MKENAKIYIAGHRGLVGSAIWKNLQQKGYTNLVGKTSSELNLLDQQATEQFFAEEKPEYVFLAAAKVGGIMANNTYRAEFLYENLVIQNHVIHNAWKYGVKKLLFLGSTCIYPKNASQPMREDALLTSPLEYTNEPYAIAKIAGIKLCESYNLQYGTNFISVMPTNLYGPNDNFDLEKSHVLPALLRKIHLGKCLENNDWQSIRRDLDQRPIESIDGNAVNNEILQILSKYGITKSPTLSAQRSNSPSVTVEIWGTGNPLREFLWSEEMADACVYLMQNINFTDIIDSTSLRFSDSQHSGTGEMNVDAGTNPDFSGGEETTTKQSHQTSTNARNEIRNTHINIGTGKEISIKALAERIAQTVGFKGKLVFNTSKPDGTMRKLTDVSKLHSLGWHHKVEIEKGLEKMYEWYIKDLSL